MTSVSNPLQCLIQDGIKSNLNSYSIYDNFSYKMLKEMILYEEPDNICCECNEYKCKNEICETYPHINDETINICFSCYDKINKKFKIHIEISDLKLLKKKIKAKTTVKSKAKTTLKAKTTAKAIANEQ